MRSDRDTMTEQASLDSATSTAILEILLLLKFPQQRRDLEDDLGDLSLRTNPEAHRRAFGKKLLYCSIESDWYRRNTMGAADAKTGRNEEDRGENSVFELNNRKQGKKKEKKTIPKVKNE